MCMSVSEPSVHRLQNSLTLECSVGFAFGPVLWAPISEVYGRRWSLLPATFCLGLFSIATSVSQNAVCIFVTRFFAGVFGSAPVSNVNAALSDMWPREVRGVAGTLYGVVVVGGPTFGPVIGSVILANPSLGWQWTQYVQAIIVFLIVAIATFGIPETYPPVLLKRKASRLRKETGNEQWWHPHETLRLDIRSLVTKQLSRPLKMLFTEPMVACMAVYGAFVYAIIYVCLEVFPIVFEEQRGYSPVKASLPFLWLFAGNVCALAIHLGNQPFYIRKCRAAEGAPVPEARLPPIAIGACLMGMYSSFSAVETLFIRASICL
jgi:MFS family permease